MSVELSEHITGWDSLRDSLEEIRTCHEEFESFFSGTFDELESLSTELIRQKDQWQTECSGHEANAVASELDGQLAQILEEARQERAEIRGTQEDVHAQVARLAAVAAELADARATSPQDGVAAAFDDEQLKQILEETRQQLAELHSTQEATRTQNERLSAVAAEMSEARAALPQDGVPVDVGDEQLKELLEETRQQLAELCNTREATQAQSEQLTGVVTELAGVRNEFNEARGEIASWREQLEVVETRAAHTSPDEQLDERLRQMEQQQSQWEQERTLLETELESVRNRSAEMAELLADQKRLSTQQQTQWADELKRMRRLLENVSQRLVETEHTSSVSRPEPSPQAVDSLADNSAKKGDDPALDSVMAQFQMLQKDLAKRRAAGAS